MEDISTDRPPPTRQIRSWFQFSIRALLGLATFVALACAALLNASEWWASLTFTITVAVLLVAVLLSIFRGGATRAFWLGFAVVGWVYVLLVFLALPRLLLTSKLLAFAWTRLFPLLRPPLPVPPGSSSATPGSPELVNFVMVGHWLWALLLAMLGGLLARYFYATREGKS